MKSFIAAAALLALFWGAGGMSIQAQTLDRGPLVLELPASTRALALGNTFQLAYRDSDAVFYHPGRVSRAEGLMGSVQRFSDRGTHLTLSAGRAWFGGGVALGIQTLTYEASADTPVDFPDLPADEAALRASGNTGIAEAVISAGYGRSAFGMQMGVVGKYVEQRIDSRKSSTLAADLGVSTSTGPITLGFSARNIGPDLSFGSRDIPLPTQLTLGASSESAMVGPLDLSATTALSYRLDGDLVPSVGLELAYWPINGRTFIGRIGYRHRPDEYSAWPVTFGGAFMGDNVILEYAFQGFEAGDPSHRISLGWR